MQWKGHGLISEVIYDKIMKICDWPNESAACGNALNEAANAIGDIDGEYARCATRVLAAQVAWIVCDRRLDGPCTRPECVAPARAAGAPS